MNEKIERLKRLLNKASLKQIDNNALFTETAQGFNVSISTNSPQRENEFLFDNIDEAAQAIHKAKKIINRNIEQTKEKLKSLCDKSNIDPNNKITIQFNDYL